MQWLQDNANSSFVLYGGCWAFGRFLAGSWFHIARFYDRDRGANHQYISYRHARSAQTIPFLYMLSSLFTIFFFFSNLFIEVRLWKALRFSPSQDGFPQACATHTNPPCVASQLPAYEQNNACHTVRNSYENFLLGGRHPSNSAERVSRDLSGTVSHPETIVRPAKCKLIFLSLNPNNLARI